MLSWFSGEDDAGALEAGARLPAVQRSPLFSVSSDLLGEISLLSGKPRTATVIAAEPTEILELDRETLRRIVVQHPQVPRIIHEISEQRAMSPEELEGRGASAARRPGS